IFGGQYAYDSTQPLIDAIKKAARTANTSKPASAPANNPAAAIIARERKVTQIQRLLVLHYLASGIQQFAKFKDDNTSTIAFGEYSDGRRTLIYQPQNTLYADLATAIREIQTRISKLRQSLLQLAEADGVDSVIDQELNALQERF